MAKDVWLVESYGGGESEILGIFSSSTKAISFMTARHASPVSGIEDFEMVWRVGTDGQKYEMTCYELNYALEHEVD